MSDYTVVYFNAIKRGFSIPAVAADFSIGSIDFEIRWYGILIALGYLLALIFCTKLAKRAKIDVDGLYDCIIWGTVGGIFGARAYYVLFNLSYYLSNPSSIWRIDEGGLAIYGGVIGAVVAALIVCKVRKMKPLDVLDLASVGFLIGQGVGRWGNFTNQEAFGKNTSLPWGMMSDKTSAYLIDNQDFCVAHGMTVSPYEGVHPTFLYESIWCILGFVLLYFLFKNYRKYRGQICLTYGAWYGLERSIVEGLRIDSLYIGSTNIRVSQLISIALCVVCLVILVVNFKKKKEQNLTAEEVIEDDQEKTEEA